MSRWITHLTAHWLRFPGMSWRAFWRLRPLYRRLSYLALIIMFVASWNLVGLPSPLPEPTKVTASVQSVGPRTATASGDCTSVTGVGTVAWGTPGNAASSTDAGASATAALGRNVTSNWLKCLNFGFTTAMIPTGSTILGVVATVNRKVSSTNSTTTDNGVRLVIGGTIQTTDRKTTTAWPTSFTSEDHGGSTDLWGATLATSDVTGSTFGVAVSAIHGSTTNSTFTFSVDYVQLTIYFTPPYNPPTLTQRHYLFEQDDGANANSNTDNGSADTALTNVKKGERLEARFQVDNTGTGSFNSGQFGLFYDRNDNIWSRVNTSGSAITGNGSCNDVKFDMCSVLDSSTVNIGQGSSMAISSAGTPWIAYPNNNSTALKVATYIGSGGNCTDSSWQCTTVHTPSTMGNSTGIAFSPSGYPWISYQGANTLYVATGSSSGGSGCTGATSSAQWTCTQVDSTSGAGAYNSIAFDSNGTAWVAYYQSATSLKVAQYVGSGGTGCASTAWTCTIIDSSAASMGQYAHIAIDAAGVPWISYYDGTNHDLKVATYVGSGGSCTSTAWSCTIVDSSIADVGQYTSIAISATNKPWISYYDATNQKVRVANYVGSSGTCTSTAWNCSSIDTTALTGQYSQIAFDPMGNAWLAYRNFTNGTPRYAHYVGTGGNCSSTAWAGCTNLEPSSVGALYESMAIDANGTVWIAYYDQVGARLKYARLNRGNEIRTALGISGANGDALTANAAGTCTSGTTFSNGTWQEGANISIATTIATSKCSEVAFMIDTTQAVVGGTYRLALRDVTDNRGLDAYSVYPTLTIVSSGSDTIHASKDQQYQMSTCTDTNWTCKNVLTNASTAPYELASTFDSNGNMWVSSSDFWTGNFWVSHYVGSGGTGCATGVTDWTCETVEKAGNEIGRYSSIGVDPSGTVWTAYVEKTVNVLHIAKYVGSGGTGCSGTGITDWTCITLDSSSGAAYTSLAFDQGGNPWVSYMQGNNQYLRVAHYVGSNGTGCSVTSWTCYDIDRGTAMGRYSNIRFNSKGKAYISYTEQSLNQVRMAEYVGSGGSGCGTGGSTEWNCTTIDDPTDITGQDLVSLAIGTDDSMWVAYPDITANDLWVAKYVGSGGTGCTNSTVAGAWSCTLVEATNSVGNNLSMAMDKQNNPWIANYDATNTALRLAKYVGGGAGSGCGGGSSDWTCSQIDNQSTNSGQWPSISFDPSGVPWIAESDETTSPYIMKVAKLNYPSTPTALRYKLDNLGYSYTAADDTNFDPMAATTNAPIYNFDLVQGNNTGNITAYWIGKSSVAASTDNIKLQVYRFGTTNAWVDMNTNTTCTANTDCIINPTAITTNLSEYYEAYGSNYITHYRVYQVAGTTKTLQTDYFAYSAPAGGPTLDQLLRGGAWIVNGVKNAFSF